MEQEKTNKPKPLDASGTLHGGLVGSLSGAASLGPVPKPPWQRFMDLNWKVGKPVLKEAAREAIVEIIKWFVSGRKRESAIAQQP